MCVCVRADYKGDGKHLDRRGDKNDQDNAFQYAFYLLL